MYDYLKVERGPLKMATSVKRKKTSIIKHVTTRRKQVGNYSPLGRLSVLSIVQATRNPNLLPEDYKKIVAAIEEGYNSSRQLALQDPLKFKRGYASKREAYYRRITRLAEIGILEKHRETYFDDVARMPRTEFVYKVVELTPVKLGPGEYLDVQVKM